jgi:hypothetical protein
VATGRGQGIGIHRADRRPDRPGDHGLFDENSGLADAFAGRLTT